MPANVSALSTYVDMNRKELLAKSIAGANSFQTSFVEIISGIKPGTSVLRKFIANTPSYNWDAGCGEPSGSTTVFTEKSLSTTLVMVGDQWCAADLTAKLANYMPAGSDLEGFEIPNEVIDDIVAQIARDNALAFYQAGRSTAPSNGVSNNMTGVLKRLINTSLSGSTFKPTSTYTAITATNAIAAVDDFVANIPAAIQGLQLEMRVPTDFFNALKTAYRNTYGAGSMEFVPGVIDNYKLLGYDNILVRRDDGLASSKVALLSVADKGNLILNVDAEGDSGEVAVWYDKTKDKTMYRIKFALGTQIKFETEVGVLNYGSAN